MGSILHSIVNQKDNRMAAKVMGKMAVGNGLLNAGLVSRAHSKHNISSWSKKKKIVVGTAGLVGAGAVATASALQYSVQALISCYTHQLCHGSTTSGSQLLMLLVYDVDSKFTSKFVLPAILWSILHFAILLVCHILKMKLKSLLLSAKSKMDQMMMVKCS